MPEPFNVVAFTLRNSIVIDFGTVTESSDPDKIGAELFFVSYVDEAGGEICIYDTPNYAWASQEAKDAKADFNAVAVIERFRLKGGQADV